MKSSCISNQPEENMNDRVGLEEVAPIFAHVDYEDEYVQPKIVEALKKHIPKVRFLNTAFELPFNQNLIIWSAYEKMDHAEIIKNPKSTICCAYIFR
jgi:hypothetical protein